MASSYTKVTNRKLLVFLAFVVMLSYGVPTIFGLKPPRLTPPDQLTPLQIKEQEAKALRQDIHALEERLAVLVARVELSDAAMALANAKNQEAVEAFSIAETEAQAANDAFSDADLRKEEANQALRYARMTEAQAKEALREATAKERTAQLALAAAQTLQEEANKALVNAQKQSRLASSTIEEIRALEQKIAELNEGIKPAPKPDTELDTEKAQTDTKTTTQTTYRDRALPQPGKAVVAFEDGMVPSHNKVKIPDGIETLTVPARKQAFIELLLPLIIKANDVILQRRDKLKAAIEAGDSETIQQLANLYGLRKFDGTQEALHAQLLNRIAPVPHSLALAQAAVESGWGQSRFAKEGNALFGQWAWSADQGIKPLDASNSRAVIRSFATIYDSVFAYIHNLNTHYAYQDFRDVRAQDIAQDKRISGLKLARYLTAYAELGEKYVYTLQSMILQNRFDIYETYRLAR